MVCHSRWIDNIYRDRPDIGTAHLPGLGQRQWGLGHCLTQRPKPLLNQQIWEKPEDLAHCVRFRYHAVTMNPASTRLPNLHVKGRLMSDSEIERTLVRLAHQIVEKN